MASETRGPGGYTLPLGHGAVVKDRFGISYVRRAHDLWESHGTLLTDSEMQDAAAAGNLTTLSEGVPGDE